MAFLSSSSVMESTLREVEEANPEMLGTKRVIGGTKRKCHSTSVMFI